MLFIDVGAKTSRRAQIIKIATTNLKFKKKNPENRNIGTRAFISGAKRKKGK